MIYKLFYRYRGKEMYMKKGYSILAVFLALIMFISVFPERNIFAGSKIGTEESINSENMSDADIEKQVNDIIANMTIEQKLAQMMIIAIRYEPDTSRGITKLTKAYKKLLKKYDFGGLLMYANNMTDINQTVTMIRETQAAAMKSANGIPMFICVDQEGGLVNRVSFGTTGSGNMALAATGDISLTEEIADILGEELSALGFNMDFAPVSDVNNNPENPVIGTRSFSDDPQTVAENVAAFIEGLNKNNISTSLKHFPGHGNVGEDSHTKLPLSELTLVELKECELIPFEAGIEAGADMIMTAHIQYPNIDDATYISKEDGQEVYLPATLSKKILTGLLRDEMGFEGIIISDSMQMDAIAKHFDETDAAVLAINAGVDLLIRPTDVYQDDEINTFPDVKRYMKKLAARVKAGDIAEERLDESVRRILKLKFKKGIMTDTLSISKKVQIKNAKKIVGTAEHHIREWDIASEGLTLVKNEDNTLPIDGMSGEKTLILIPSEYRRASVEYAISRLERESLVDSKNIDVICYSDITIKNKALKKALNKADNVLILSQSTKKNDQVCQIIEKAHQNGSKVTFLSLNLPYDVACYTDVDAVLCAYNAYGNAYDSEGNGPFNLNVAAAICSVFAETVPQGVLPVNIPKIIENEDGSISYSDELLYERGFGIIPIDTKCIGLAGVRNARELGGYVNADSYRIKNGVFIHTAKLSEATDADIEKLVNKYNLGLIIDLRGSGENEREPDPEIDGVRHIGINVLELPKLKDGEKPKEIPKEDEDLSNEEKLARERERLESGMFNDQFYVSILSSDAGKAGYKQFFEEILNLPAGKSVLYHCSQGKDRTGCASMLILFALGFDAETVVDEFLLTNVYNAVAIAGERAELKAIGAEPDELEKMMASKDQVNAGHMTNVIDWMTEEYGSPLGYIKTELGLADDQIIVLRERYLEKIDK